MRDIIDTKSLPNTNQNINDTVRKHGFTDKLLFNIWEYMEMDTVVDYLKIVKYFEKYR